MKTFRGYRQGQSGGGVLVTVSENGEEHVLALPALLRGEARHSPDGFQFGYGGSGPAELARAILIATYPADPAVRHPQQFKFDVVAKWKDDTWTLSSAQIQEWRDAWESQRAPKHG